MSLFDDLLNQSKPIQNGSEPPVDPLNIPATPIIISESTPLISPEPVTPVAMSVETPEIVTPTLGDNSAILISSEPSISITTDPVGEVASSKTETQADTSGLTTSPLFDMSEPVATIAVEVGAPVTNEASDTDMSSLLDGVSASAPEEATQKETKIPFHDTNEYINHAMKEVSELIADIDAEDALILAAEDEHRKQKEHYAELETADEAAHQKNLEERAHAEKMKKYLEKEQGISHKKDEPEAVNTSL